MKWTTTNQKMSKSAGVRKTRGLQTINCKYDTVGVTADINRQAKRDISMGYWRQYQSVSDPQSRSIMAGEVVWTTKQRGPAPDGQFFVRSMLNGVCFKTRSGTHTEEALYDMVRFVGMSLKHIAYDGLRPEYGPSDDPVVVLCGAMQLVNLGKKHIGVGDAIEAYFVPAETTNQYQDDVHSLPADRLVVGLRSLEMRKSIFDEIEDLGLTVAFKAWTETANDAAYETLKGDKDVIKAGEHLLQAIRASVMWRMRNVVGVATTSAPAGGRFDWLVQPLVNYPAKANLT